MSTSSDGRANRSRSSGIRECPPASSFASSRPSSSIASSIDLRGRLHCVDDVVVARAAAEVALEPEADLLLRRVRALLQQRHRRHHETRRAEAALERMVLVEGLLDGMQPGVSGQALDRRHRASVGLDGQHRARLHRLPVEQHGARTTRSRVAADVRPLQPQVLAQEVDEQRARLDVRGLLGAVDRNRELHAFASWIARHTFSPLAGMSTCFTPSGASASTTAL